MADLTEQMGNQVLKIGGAMIQSSAEFIEELLKILDKNKQDDPMKYTIYQHLQAGKGVYTAFVNDLDKSDMERHLTEQGVAYTFMNLPNDNSKLLLVRDVDKTKAEFAAKLLLAERGLITEFERDEFLQMTPQSKVAVISNMSLSEYELFRERAKDNKLQFAATIDEKGVVSILYNIEDRKEADKSLAQLSWDMTGENGLSYRNAYLAKAETQEVINDLYGKDFADLKGVYIIDAAHPDRVFKIGSKGVAICEKYDNNKSERDNFDEVEKISIKDPEYNEKLQMALAKMEQPVALKVNNIKEREEILHKKMPKLDKQKQKVEFDYRTIYEQEFSAKDEYNVAQKQDTSTRKVSVITTIQNKMKDEKLNPDDAKRIEAHVKEAAENIKKYTIHIPKEKELDRVIEKAKNQKTVNDAKRDFERSMGREMGKGLKKKSQEKE